MAASHALCVFEIQHCTIDKDNVFLLHVHLDAYVVLENDLIKTCIKNLSLQSTISLGSKACGKTFFLL